MLMTAVTTCLVMHTHEHNKIRRAIVTHHVITRHYARLMCVEWAFGLLCTIGCPKSTMCRISLYLFKSRINMFVLYCNCVLDRVVFNQYAFVYPVPCALVRVPFICVFVQQGNGESCAWPREWKRNAYYDILYFVVCIFRGCSNAIWIEVCVLLLCGSFSPCLISEFLMLTCFVEFQ